MADEAALWGTFGKDAPDAHEDRPHPSERRSKGKKKKKEKKKEKKSSSRRKSKGAFVCLRLFVIVRDCGFAIACCKRVGVSCAIYA